jgi:hypothetical protein
VELTFEEQRLHKERPEGVRALHRGTTRTKIRIAVSPRRNRDRRCEDAMARAKDVLTSFRSYLMASEEESSLPTGVLTRAKRILAPWLVKR